MSQLPSSAEPYWKTSAPSMQFPKLNENITVDVAIIGGGITGLTAAYLLKQTGRTVAVLEKNTLGSGATSGTTGKLTSQHNIIYARLKKRLGQREARIYAEANQWAVEQIANLIKSEQLACDWQRADNYVYTADPKRVAQFKEEAVIAADLGLPASFETSLNLPFHVEAAVKFTDQAQFHAQKYVLGLAKLIDGQGSAVFEHTNATGIRDGKPCRVRADNVSVTAKDILVTTKVPAAPLIARGTYCALEYPHTSYIVAGKLDMPLKGMYISPDHGHYSILPVSNGRERLLFIGGEHHIPGLGFPEKHYRKLADYAEKFFGITALQYRWKAMDYLAYDDLPLIGKVYPWSKHLYTATGFKKWGLSTSMFAAMILRDAICNEPNPWAAVFDPHRLKAITSIPAVILGR